MGQKVHPEVLRVGYIHDWKSTWFNEKEFSDYLLDVVADADVLEQVVGELLLVEPSRLPVVDVAHAQDLGMDLLTHRATRRSCRLQMDERGPRVRGGAKTEL